MGITLLAVGSLIALIGIAFGVSGVLELRRLRAMHALEAIPFAAIREGTLARIRGTAMSAEPPHRAPLTGREAIFSFVSASWSGHGGTRRILRNGAFFLQCPESGEKVFVSKGVRLCLPEHWFSTGNLYGPHVTHGGPPTPKQLAWARATWPDRRQFDHFVEVRVEAGQTFSFIGRFVRGSAGWTPAPDTRQPPTLLHDAVSLGDAKSTRVMSLVTIGIGLVFVAAGLAVRMWRS